MNRATYRNSGRGGRWIAVAALLMATAHCAPAEELFRPTAAVVEFHDTSTYRNRLMGRRAADRLALELAATGRWRIVDRARTAEALAEQGQRPPLAVAYLQQLGNTLAADVIFSGTVQSVVVDAQRGTVTVGALVEAVDQVAGHSVLTMMLEGQSRRDNRKPRPTDVMIEEALGQVMAEAARAAGVDVGVRGEVAAPSQEQVVQLRFARGGMVKTGDRFLLYRALPEGESTIPGRLIGSLIINSVSEQSATARILERAGDIHTGDIAVRICNVQVN